MRRLACLLLFAGCFEEPSYEGRFCDEPSPCPQGFRCVVGQCTARDPAPLDAGDEPSDASAGLDALPKDAGTIDAGPIDAGEPTDRCTDPVNHPADGWEVRHFRLTGNTLDACFGVEDLLTGDIARDYQSGGPVEGGPIDFGSRYTATRDFEAGVYTFTFAHDDGIRVRIDGRLIYDVWLHGAVPQARAYTEYLSAGPHQLEVEHFDDEGFAELSVSWQRGCSDLTAPAVGAWIASYHAYDPGTNALVLEHCYGFETVPSAFLSFSGPPDALVAQGIATNYGIVGRGRHDHQGLTSIAFEYEDGLRANLDGTRVVEDWIAGPPARVEVDRYLPDVAEISFEKFVTTATDDFSISWSTACERMPAIGATEWWARYYRVDYVASPESWTLDRSDCLGAQLIFADRLMESGNPGPIVTLNVTQLWGAELFGARSFAANTNVTVTYDDGVRVFDGQSLILDDWTAPQVESAMITFGQGAHSFRMEYFQNFGGAQLQFVW